MKLFISLIFFSSVASACPAGSLLPENALRTLYQNADVKDYVCVDNEKCSESEFLALLDVKEIKLSAVPRNKVCAVLVEPAKKGRQYFSAVFVKSADATRMVFSPDPTLSGIKVLPKTKNNFYILRGMERDSTDSWKETDFGYDPQSKQYAEIKTRCFRENDGKITTVKCEG